MSLWYFRKKEHALPLYSINLNVFDIRVFKPRLVPNACSFVLINCSVTMSECKIILLMCFLQHIFIHHKCIHSLTGLSVHWSFIYHCTTHIRFHGSPFSYPYFSCGANFSPLEPNISFTFLYHPVTQSPSFLPNQHIISAGPVSVTPPYFLKFNLQ